MIPPDLMTTTEVATALRCSNRYVYDLVRQGVAVPLRIGTAPNAEMRFRPEDVDKLIRHMTPAPRPTRKRRRRAA